MGDRLSFGEGISGLFALGFVPPQVTVPSVWNHRSLTTIIQDALLPIRRFRVETCATKRGSCTYLKLFLMEHKAFRLSGI
jgi:hypothetical protein